MSLRLIIFDLDGTLVDSSADIMHALNYSVEPYSSRRFTVPETITLVGEGIPRLIEKITPGADEQMRAKVMERFTHHYVTHLLDHTTVYPGIPETLARLNEYRKAVVSNKREFLSKMVLEGLGLSRYFDLVIGSDSVAANKPSPVPLLKVLSDLHFQPDEAVMVGDSNYDVDAGKAAGIRTVAVTYGYRPIEAIRHADFLIDRMSDLVPLVEKLKGDEGRGTAR